MLWPSYRWAPLPKSCDSDKPSHVMGEASVKCCVCCCYTLAHACLQALQYKTQATQAQLKAQQETEARKRIEAEAARAVAARMTEKPRVSSPFSSTTGRCTVLGLHWAKGCFPGHNLTAASGLVCFHVKAVAHDRNSCCRASMVWRPATAGGKLHLHQLMEVQLGTPQVLLALLAKMPTEAPPCTVKALQLHHT